MSNEGNFFPKTQEKNYQLKILQKTEMYDKLYKIWGFLRILVAILCFANLKVKVTKYRMSTDRFEFSTHTLC